MDVIASFSRKMLPHDRIGLVSFSSSSLILSYLTEDPHNIFYYLDYLRDETTVSLGTNIGQALRHGLAILTRELEVNPQASLHKRVFILVSDGEDHGKELESAVEEVKRLGIKVHTIGIGSKGGAPIPVAWENGSVSYLEDQEGNIILTSFDETTLRWIAEETGANAYRSFTGRELEGKFAEIARKERKSKVLKGSPSIRMSIKNSCWWPWEYFLLLCCCRITPYGRERTTDPGKGFFSDPAHSPGDQQGHCQAGVAHSASPNRPLFRNPVLL